MDKIGPQSTNMKKFLLIMSMGSGYKFGIWKAYVYTSNGYHAFTSSNAFLPELIIGRNLYFLAQASCSLQFRVDVGAMARSPSPQSLFSEIIRLSSFVLHFNKFKFLYLLVYFCLPFPQYLFKFQFEFNVGREFDSYGYLQVI